MKIVRESILLESDRAHICAGLVVIQDGKMLLVHPTGTSWDGTLSIPKGHVEPGEELLQAAMRETREETGIDTSRLEVEDEDARHFVDYVNKNGELKKRVYYFVARPTVEIKEFRPQMEEVDWCGFLGRAEAKEKIFWRFEKLLGLIE